MYSERVFRQPGAPLRICAGKRLNKTPSYMQDNGAFVRIPYALATLTARLGSFVFPSSKNTIGMLFYQVSAFNCNLLWITSYAQEDEISAKLTIVFLVLEINLW